MPITISCTCGKLLKVPDELAGKKGKCPGCGAVLSIPALADPEILPPGPLLETTPPIKVRAAAPAPGPVPAPAAWAPPPAPPPPPRTSGMAIAALISGFLCGPLGIVLGILAMAKVKKSRGALGGFGLALGGTIVGALWIVAGIGFGALGYGIYTIGVKTIRIQVALKALADAENSYYRAAKAYWTADVAGLQGLREAIAAADGDAAGSRPYHGYYFVAMDSDESGNDLKSDAGHPDSYAFCAYPVEKDSPFSFTFVMSRHGGVLMGTNGGQPQRKWPAASQIGQGRPWQPVDDRNSPLVEPD